MKELKGPQPLQKFIEQKKTSRRTEYKLQRTKEQNGTEKLKKQKKETKKIKQKSAFGSSLIAAAIGRIAVRDLTSL